MKTGDWYRAYYGHEQLSSRVTHLMDVGSYALQDAGTLHCQLTSEASTELSTRVAAAELARHTMLEMRISATPVVLTEICARHSIDLDELIELVKVEAQRTLTGVALAGALRALAWCSHQNSWHVKRRELSEQARRQYSESGAQTGYSNLLADDAHAHLWGAKSFITTDGSQRENDLLAFRGYLFLGAALSSALRESWSPFVLYRLDREINEHSDCQQLVSEKSAWILAKIFTLRQRLHDKWEAANNRYRDQMTNLNGDDLGAYLMTVRDAPKYLEEEELDAEDALFLAFAENQIRII